MSNPSRVSPTHIEQLLKSISVLRSRLAIKHRSRPAGMSDYIASEARRILAKNETSVRSSFLKILDQNEQQLSALVTRFRQHSITAKEFGAKFVSAERVRAAFIAAVKIGVVDAEINDEIILYASDGLLCKAVQSGNKQLANEAIKILIDRNRRSIEAFKKKHFGLDPAEVEVRSIEAVWRSARLYNPDHKSKASFNTHLYRWLNRNARARTKGDKGDFILAREAGKKIVGESVLGSSGETSSIFSILPSVEQDVQDHFSRGDMTRMRRALKQLSDRQRAVIESRFYKGYSLTKTSSELQCSVEDVLGDIESALSAMRSKLEV